MPQRHGEKLTKGQRTSQRILDAAEQVFALQGYEGASLRQIADAVGIREPGLYNHFTGKRAIYEAVLQRSLQVLAEALTDRFRQASNLHDYTELPGLVTDLLLDHPPMAALLQQALHSPPDSPAAVLFKQWLVALLPKGLASLQRSGIDVQSDQRSLAVNLIALLNLTTGYFLAGCSYEALATGSLTDEEQIARQKRLLRNVVRAMLVN
jgi:AcrR family transcriptional regulator